MTCIFSSRCGKQDYFPQIEFEIISFAYRVFIVNLFLRRGNSCFQHWFNEFAILSESFFEQSLWPSLTNCLILQRNHNLDNPVLTTFYMQIPYDVISVMHVFSNYGWSPWHKEAPLCGLILSLLSDSRRSWSCVHHFPVGSWKMISLLFSSTSWYPEYLLKSFLILEF